MKLRVVPALLAAALGLGSLLVAAPANAVPAAPGIGTLDSSTAGSVSGSVTSAEPYVFVAVVTTSDASEPTRTKLTMSSSSSFSLPTWGYGADAAVRAWACPTGAFSAVDCSAPATSSFTPTDLVPEVTWFEDIYIGPADPNPTITVSDPGGGGVIKAGWYWEYGSEQTAVLVTPGVPTDLGSDVPIFRNGSIRLSRCSAADFLHCTPFTPEVKKALFVQRVLEMDVTPFTIPVVTSTVDSHFGLNVRFSGPLVVTWHLETVADPGVPIAGTEHVDNRTADIEGDIEPITISRSNLADGSYKVVGAVDMQTTSVYGDFHDQHFSAPFTVDKTGPAVTIVANHNKIWPFLPTLHPSSVTWTITGDLADVNRISVRSAAGNLVASPTLHKTSDNAATAAWSGKWPDGSAKDGTYKLVATDKRANPTSSPSVTVDNTRLVVKTFTKTVTAGGSLEDQYVGKCSTLRKPSLRGWSYSLGLYANTKCSSQTSKDSVVNTIHAVKLPTAYSYVDVKVSTYGGAASAKPQSPAVLQYLTVNGDLVSRQRLSSTLGTHRGEVRSARNMIFSDHVFAWSVYTGFGYRYDLKSFTVVVHYKVLI